MWARGNLPIEVEVHSRGFPLIRGHFMCCVYVDLLSVGMPSPVKQKKKKKKKSRSFSGSLPSLNRFSTDETLEDEDFDGSSRVCITSSIAAPPPSEGSIPHPHTPVPLVPSTRSFITCCMF